MTTTPLTYKELLQIAPEITLHGEIDHADLAKIKAMLSAIEIKTIRQLTGNANAPDVRVTRILIDVMNHSSYPDACMGLYDAIRHIQAVGVEVFVLATGMCYGNATLLMLAALPPNRYTTANTRFSVEIPDCARAGFRAAPEEPVAGSIGAAVLAIYEANLLLPRDEILDLPGKTFSAQQACEYGLIDYIV